MDKNVTGETARQIADAMESSWGVHEIDSCMETTAAPALRSLADQLDAAKTNVARAHDRVHTSKDVENCPFCATYPATGHAQQVPMCHLCTSESERDSLIDRLAAATARCETVERALDDERSAFTAATVTIENLGMRLAASGGAGKRSDEWFSACMKRMMEAAGESWGDWHEESIDSMVEHIAEMAPKADETDLLRAIARKIADAISGPLHWGWDGDPRSLVGWCERLANFKADAESAKYLPPAPAPIEPAGWPASLPPPVDAADEVRRALTFEANTGIKPLTPAPSEPGAM